MTTIDIRKYPLHLVRGNVRTDDGLVGRHMQLPVHVSPEGVAYNDQTGYAYTAERWGDGDYFDATSNGFMLDAGEFERCGIAFKRCGSAANKAEA